MGVYTCDGIVLKQFDLGEADKIITFYTNNRGKVRAVARNARKSGSRFSGLVLPFSYSEITVYRGRSLDRLNSINGKHAFTRLRDDLEKMAYASYMAEVVNRVGMEDDPNPRLFSLLLSAYRQLLESNGEVSEKINLAFKARLLVVLGFKPQLEYCPVCEREFKTGDINYFDIARGGPVCQDCREDREHIREISGETIGVFRQLMSGGMDRLNKFHISADSRKQLSELLDRFILYHLELRPKSQEFLHMIRDLG